MSRDFREKIGLAFYDIAKLHLHGNNSTNYKYHVFNQLITFACESVDNNCYFRAVYLYLTAYDVATTLDKDSLDVALYGLENAWDIAIAYKSRSVAENILGIFRNYKTKQELISYSDQLNKLMIEKLEEIAYSKGLIDSKNNEDIIKNVKEFLENGEDSSSGLVNSSATIDINSLKDMLPFNKPINKDSIKSANIEIDDNVVDQLLGVLKSAFNAPNSSKPQKNVNNSNNDNNNKNALNNDAYYIKKNVLKYENLVGFDVAIDFMRELGLGVKNKTQYMSLIEKLNKEHGLNRAAQSKTVIFKSPSRMDAKIFMEATAAEVNMPIIHMHMEENISGANILCMMASADSNFRLNPARTGFNGKGILILEDVDMWDFPEINFDDLDGFSSFMNAQISRGIAEVINLIEVAIEDPNILVLASVKNNIEESKFAKMIFQDYFEVPIAFPNDQERLAIWQRLAQDHPSLRAFNLEKLVKYSSNMSRYDIEIAAHEALEDAYQEGIEKREYIPLKISKIIEKLAENYPLDSNEYKELEDVAFEDFKKDIDNIDDILK